MHVRVWELTVDLAGYRRLDESAGNHKRSAKVLALEASPRTGATLLALPAALEARQTPMQPRDAEHTHIVLKLACGDVLASEEQQIGADDGRTVAASRERKVACRFGLGPLDSVAR